MTTWLVINLRLPGFHRWLDAPQAFKYLRSWHRHEFHIKCEIEVGGNREFEFIALKDTITQYLLDRLGLKHGMFLDLPDKGFETHIVLDNDAAPEQSVEGLAYFIAKYLKDDVDKRVRVTVMEDGENGATVEV